MGMGKGNQHRTSCIVLTYFGSTMITRLLTKSKNDLVLALAHLSIHVLYISFQWPVIPPTLHDTSVTCHQVGTMTCDWAHISSHQVPTVIHDMTNNLKFYSNLLVSNSVIMTFPQEIGYTLIIWCGYVILSVAGVWVIRKDNPMTANVLIGTSWVSVVGIWAGASPRLKRVMSVVEQ